MGLSVVCAAAMSNSFNTELQAQARTSNASTGDKSFPSQDQQVLGAAASDFLKKVVLFLPVYISLFISVSSPTVPKNHLQNSELFSFIYFFCGTINS